MSKLYLYMHEYCPFCHRVMDFAAMHRLELQYKNIRELPEYKAELIERGGKSQVPYLYDENTGIEMYESSDIIQYLETNYI